jgi:ATP-binding cassette, subfamily B, bacterial
VPVAPKPAVQAPVEDVAPVSAVAVGPAQPDTGAAEDTGHVARPDATPGIPGIEALNPLNAPAWLRPILYLLLGATIAVLAAVIAPARVRRRLLQRIAPSAEREAALAATPAVPIREIFRRFWPYTKSHRRWLLVTLALVPVGPAVQTGGALLFSRLVDDVLVPHDFGPFPSLALAFVGLAVIGALASFADDFFSAIAGERFVLDLRTGLFRHLHGLSLDFFERRRLGDVVARLTGDIGAIETLVLSGVASALGYLLRIAFFSAALFYLRWDLTVVSLAAAPLFLFTAKRFARRRKAASREARRRNGAMSAVAEESLANVQLVQAFHREDAEVSRFRVESHGSLVAQIASTRIRAVYGSLVELIELAGVLLIVGLGTWELAQGWLTVGELLAFLALLSQLYQPIRGLGRLGNSMSSATASAERIIELLDERPTVVEQPGAKVLARSDGELSFDHVSFRYPGAAADVLSDVSFHVAPGEIVAVIGRSGAGKSTLAKLLLRFYDPASGSVMLDGEDIRTVTLRSLREQVAVVFQETFVFDDSIAANIAYSDPTATREQVLAAAEAAALMPFVESQPDGLETIVGQKGRRLSGGERQRIAIARAFLRDAPILLLDEPTTGLDVDAANHVIEPLRRLAAGRTTIVISHDLALARIASRVLLVDEGVVSELESPAAIDDADDLFGRLHRKRVAQDPHEVVG